MHIRTAATSDLPLMQDIERAAGSWFREIGMPEIADDEPLSVHELARYQRDNRAWVAVDDPGVPVAYLIADIVDGAMHIEQVSVHPRAARRKIGRMLLEHAAADAAARGLRALTLTTFAEVPWNAPYYARCGFRVLDDTELSPGMRAIWDREIAHGLHRWPRVFMRRDLDIAAPARREVREDDGHGNGQDSPVGAGLRAGGDPDHVRGGAAPRGSAAGHGLAGQDPDGRRDSAPGRRVRDPRPPVRAEIADQGYSSTRPARRQASALGVDADVTGRRPRY